MYTAATRVLLGNCPNRQIGHPRIRNILFGGIYRQMRQKHSPCERLSWALLHKAMASSYERGSFGSIWDPGLRVQTTRVAHRVRDMIPLWNTTVVLFRDQNQFPPSPIRGL